MPASSNINKVIYVELDVSQLDSLKLRNLVSGILQTAPNAAPYATSTLLQGGVTLLQHSSDAYDAAENTVIATQAKLAADIKARDDARGELVTSVVQFRGLVQTTAKSQADVAALGFTALTRTSSGALMVPTGVDVFYPKVGQGRAKVIVQWTGKRDRHDCQICLDPFTQNAWTDLDGDGRSHWLTTYKSGTVLWVRFRAVRGHDKSDWCNPVPLTIP